MCGPTGYYSTISVSVQQPLDTQVAMVGLCQWQVFDCHVALYDPEGGLRWGGVLGLWDLWDWAWLSWLSTSARREHGTWFQQALWC